MRAMRAEITDQECMLPRQHHLMNTHCSSSKNHDSGQGQRFLSCIDLTTATATATLVLYNSGT